jgi:hypothetical protein
MFPTQDFNNFEFKNLQIQNTKLFYNIKLKNNNHILYIFHQKVYNSDHIFSCIHYKSTNNNNIIIVKNSHHMCIEFLKSREFDRYDYSNLNYNYNLLLKYFNDDKKIIEYHPLHKFWKFYLHDEIFDNFENFIYSFTTKQLEYIKNKRKFDEISFFLSCCVKIDKQNYCEENKSFMYEASKKIDNFLLFCEIDLMKFLF